MNNFLVFLCFVAIIAVVPATDYCSITCKNGYRHIACGNSGQFSSRCSGPRLVDFDNSLKQFIVDAHNKKRNFIAGGGESKLRRACRMGSIEWDDDLAYGATFNVKQCEMNHDKCHNTVAFTYAGQNLAYRSYYEPANHTELLQLLVDDWYEEVKDVRQSQIDYFPRQYSGPQILHFTELVVERNIRVGCAASTYDRPGKSYRIYLLACNYASITMSERPVYTSCDRPAAKCTQTNPQYKNLCSTSEKYDVNNWS